MTNHLLNMPPHPWQIDQWASFVSMVQNKKLPHAILVTGSEGLGLDSFVLAMAQYRLCLSPVDAIACGKCKSCLLLNASSHPDLLIIEPQSDSGQLVVDQIREINGFVSQTPSQGKAKCIVIRPAHAMNLNAANALLKNLEEPAGETFFALGSTQAGRLLPTIRSRCRNMGLVLPSTHEATAWLQNQGVQKVEEYLTASGGLPVKARDWFVEGKLEERQKLLESLTALTERRANIAATVKVWSASDALDFIEVAMVWIESRIRQRARETENGQRTLPEKVLFRYRDRLCKKKALLQSTANINVALVLEEVAFDSYALGKSLSR